MSLWLAALVIAGVVAAAVAAKMLVRRRAPRGGYFIDSARSAGALSVIGTMFAVVLAFVIFLALESFQRARAVIEDEWPAMKEERASDRVEAWIATLARTIGQVEPHGAREESAYGQWFDQESLRRDGRRGRLAEASPFVPLPLWVVLGLGAALVIAYMCVQADRREGALIQAIPIGFVTAMVIGGLLVVAFLDRPYEDESGSIRPTEMRRTLELMEQAEARTGVAVPAPCDERGSLLD